MNMRNPVAKYARAYNKAKAFKDRKKAAKRGYQKHKKGPDSFRSFYFLPREKFIKPAFTIGSLPGCSLALPPRPAAIKSLRSCLAAFVRPVTVRLTHCSQSSASDHGSTYPLAQQ